MKKIRLSVAMLAAVMTSVICPMRGHAEPYIPMIDENKAWEYNLYLNYFFHEPISESVTFRFDGEVEKYGKTYHIFKTTPEGIGYINEAFLDFYGGLPEEFYMREEDKKVYMLPYPQMTQGRYACDGLSPSDEILVYDFSGGKEDVVFETIAMMGWDDDSRYMRITVGMSMLDETYEHNGKQYPLYRAEQIVEEGEDIIADFMDKIAQGIGPVTGGIVPWQNTVPKTPTDYYPQPIFDFQSFKDLSGIKKVSAARESDTVEYFNLQGQKVMNPAPGQLVIRKCGDKVEKIVM